MIILNASGQTCNKFFTYLAYLGDSMDSGKRIIILSPDITLKYFPEMKNSKFLIFPLYNENISKIIGYNFYIRALKLLFSNRISIKIQQYFFRLIPRFQFINAPTNSNTSKTHLKYTKELKVLFSPCKTITSEIDKLFEPIVKSSDIICGIHIRRGDYKKWNDGKYYYSDIQFLDIMKKFRELFKDKSVAFFIASNDNVDFSVFNSCNYFTIKQSNSVKDLYALSKCDYLIGPPSTFSGWASYYGDSLINFIEDPKQKLEKSSFKNIMEIW